MLGRLPLTFSFWGVNGIRNLLHNSSFSHVFSWYRLFFIKDNASRCSQALQNTISENINPSRLPLTLEFKPGIKAVQGTALEMRTLGNYTLCYQAIIQDKVCMINAETFCGHTLKLGLECIAQCYVCQ